jgi:hypothetical protein
MAAGSQEADDDTRTPTKVSDHHLCQLPIYAD